ncbi:MAG: lipid A biosynthesis acyltransferase [Alphaproteobacteria bacterium]|nr:lipid A biosynthesis acyltransferase [Alphaproteobacteria bacterium]HCQ70995.1 lipid A biosynthesis acyltransferase [Rhodospirillaceae bacterium]|tara:strand:+ start:14563 stop:15417 length:855 start_codon:yes stop_codon:yes gene_type:complete
MTRVRYALEAFFLGALFLIFRLMPVDVASAVGGAIGRFVGPKMAASRKARRHLQQCLTDMDDAHAKGVIADMWDNLGRVVAEYPHLRYIVANRMTVNGAEHIDAVLASPDKGGVFFSAHFANWELPPIYLHVVKGMDIHSMYRAPNNPFVDQMIHYCRTLRGAIPAWNKSRAGGQGAMKALRAGGSLAILIDQKYNEGINVPFFGMDAMTNPFFVKMAKKFGLPLIPASMVRTKGAHFILNVHPPIHVEGREEDEIIKDAHAMIEEAITQTPSQWIWMHRRWRG